MRGLRRVALLGGAVVIAFAAMACGDDSEPVINTGEPAAATAPVTGGGGDAAHDVDMTRCESVEQSVRALFPDASLIVDATAFEADGGAILKQGCRVLVVGDSDEMSSFLELASELRAVLTGDGWVEDSQYAADGPTATATVAVFERGEELALVAASVQPKDATACAADQIIGDCLESLEADEILVQGAIVVAVE